MLTSVRVEVAMKFTPSKRADVAAREYEMYTYLNAINNTDVERYGIPTVYYYGTWKDNILIAVTLLDPAFNKKSKDRELQEVDILITFREFVSL